MRISAIKFVAMLSSGLVCAGTTLDAALSAAEILHVLSLHSSERLMSVVEGQSYKDESGVWYVQADTATRVSRVNELCEKTRIFAAIIRSDLDKESWKVIEADRTTAVAIRRNDSLSCQELPAAAFFAVSDTARLGDVKMLADAVKQMQPCARNSEDCNTRITATPWSILDNLADARMHPIVQSMDLDPNLSSENLSCYGVLFSIDNSNKIYKAVISITNGRVREMDIVQVVR